MEPFKMGIVQFENYLVKASVVLVGFKRLQEGVIWCYEWWYDFDDMSDGNASFLRAARAGNVEKVLEYLKGSIDINTSNANGLNALHLASKEGHINVVLELVKKGANVNAATKKGNTALHIASLAGQEEVVKVLVRNGANVNVQSQNGFTPLYMAAQENHDNVVKFLLANGANQSLATEDGFTPLAVALQQGHDKVVAVLLENDAKGRVRLPALHIAAKKDDCKAAALLLQNDHDPDVTSKSGFTPLHIAAHYGNENIGSLLLEKNADVNFSAKHQITPLHVAAKWGKSNMVTILVEKGAKIDASTRDGLTPLHCAARSGHDQVVDLLLEKGAPITAKTKNGLAPLHMASQGDHVDGARILLYHKAPVDDVTVDYLTALHVAAHCGHVRVAKLLLDRKADPNARALNGFTPLHIACKKNRIKVVELLLKHGASIEATTESGLTPLHVASFMGCMNIVIYLIQHGANPDVPTVRGETPLHLAARANQSDIIRILLRNGAHVDASAREQQTPLHIAARLGNVDIVGLLLQHGAAVDAPTKDMYTALHIAAKEGQEEVASVLLDHGASLTSTTKKGFTPLHLAAKYGNIKVARLLLQKDAPVDSQGKNGVTPLHVAAHYDHVNVALLLLDKGAYPHATAKNGYTPLHIAAKKNQMDIATTLLEYGAKPNAESKAGFTPLHLASQEGHTDMTTLLIEHHADANISAKNGLTPMHLCAQEDRVNVAAILVKNGSDIGPQTKAGYTPLHVACHFGQINMIRFLLQHGADVNATTSHGYTPLHQAAQQGHTLIINLLLEHKASPNTTTSQGQTALSIAQRLGYVSVVETLKIVTETVVTTTTTTITEEKYKVVVPETMHETFMSDSEDEGAEETMLGDQSFRYLTADEMKSLGDDSLPIDVTRDERGMDSMLSAPLTAEEDHLTPQHIVQQESTFSSTLAADNVDLTRPPVHAGKLKWKTFLVSFMVDARGGAMRGCRHSGVRVIIPPRKAPMPMRITCRYLRKEKLAHPPPLMEGEACASRILEVGPAGAKFLGPVIIEVPHFAALRGREREITILRSDNGESWKEHTLEASDDAVHDVFNESFEGEELTAIEDLNTNRITRILTTDFPQYFALITRIRQEVHAIGPEGGMVSSTVVPQVQAIFPEGALTKKIKVGLQAHPITPELVTKMLGNRVAVSPIVTVEPRRRKFHKPITLTIPVPQAATKGMINQYSGDTPTLRLLCSITGSTKTGGTTKAQWEDVTGSTPLTFVNDCVSFTTTVSARFWLMDCRQVNEATKFATELYREAIYVPFMAKFVVFAKRHDPLEAQLRVFCMTDDKEDKTLESQEHFSEVAKSRDVEVLEAKHQYLEFAGNLVPVTKSGEQLSLTFQAFRENRLPFTIRVKDPHQEPLGRVAFMREPRVGRGEPPQTPICNLNIALPEAQLTPVSELVTLEKKYGFVEETGLANPELIHRADLRLSDIAKELRSDWVPLALQLDVPETDINSIRCECPDNVNQQALIMLRHWLQRAGNKATGNSLEKALRKINREDIVNQCMFNVELVTDDVEKAVAKVHLDQSGFDTFKEELGSSRDASLRRDASLNGTLDERDIMKEAESAAETSSESSDKEAHHKQELESQQMIIAEEHIQPEHKEVVLIRETIKKSEASLIELSSSRSKSEEQSDSNIHELSNGIIDDEKFEPTTAVSNEMGEEAEVSADDQLDGDTHTERRDCPNNKAFPAGRKKAQKLLLTSIRKKSEFKEHGACLDTEHKLNSNVPENESKKSFPPYRSQRAATKKVSFDMGHHTASPPLFKKKRPLVRQGSWPPTSIPGQRTRKKKQRKYVKAMKNVNTLSLRSESTPLLKDSYEWLLWNDEPEIFREIPLAKCDELEETTNFNDPSSLQLLVSCEADIPVAKKQVLPLKENTDLNSSKEKKISAKESCNLIINTLSNAFPESEIPYCTNKFAVQELAHIEAIRAKIHHSRRFARRSLPCVSELTELSLTNDFENIYNPNQNYGEFPVQNIYDFENYENPVTSYVFPPFQLDENLMPQSRTFNRAPNPPRSILRKERSGNLHLNQDKHILKDTNYSVRSAPLGNDNNNRGSQNTTNNKPEKSNPDSQQSFNESRDVPISTSQEPHLGATGTPAVIPLASSPGHSAIREILDETGKSADTKDESEETKDESEEALLGRVFLRSLSEHIESSKTEKQSAASVIGQVFLKTLMEQSSADSESSTSTDLSHSKQVLPSALAGQMFLKSLLDQEMQNVEESESGNISLSAQYADVKQSQENIIPSSVLSQVFLKALSEQKSSDESMAEKTIPSSVVTQMFLKSMMEQETSEPSVQKETLPACVVGQEFLRHLIDQSSTESKFVDQPIVSSEKSVLASVVGQEFIKSLISDSSIAETPETCPIPASVVSQLFLKSLTEQAPETSEIEKPIPSSVVSQMFLKSLVKQASETSEAEKPIPSSIVSQMFLKSLADQVSETPAEEKTIPASVLSQLFLKSLAEQASETSKTEKPIPSSVVNQMFLKSLADQVSETSAEEKTIPASVVSQLFLKSLAEQAPETSETEKPIPSSVVGQLFLKSLVKQASETSEAEKPIPSSVVSQMFLKSLAEQASTTSETEKPIPSSVVSQMFLKALTEQVSETSTEDKAIPASVVSQMFLKSLTDQVPEASSEGKPVPASIVSQLFLKSLTDQASEIPAEEKTIPASVVSQTFLKSMLEHISSESLEEKIKSDSNPEQMISKPILKEQPSKMEMGEKSIPASIIGQTFIKSLLEEGSSGEKFASSISPQNSGLLTDQRSCASEEKAIPASVVGQAFLKYLTGEQVSQLEFGEKTIPSSVVSQSFLKSLLDAQSVALEKPSASTVEELPLETHSTEDALESEKSIPASVVGQMFLKSLTEQSISTTEESLKEDSIPSSILGQIFLKSLVEGQTFETEKSKDKAIPASVVGQTFLKSLTEQQKSLSSSTSVSDQLRSKSSIEEHSLITSPVENIIPASVVGQCFLKSLSDIQTSESSRSEGKPIPASVVGQAFLKSLTDQSHSLEETVIPSSVIGQSFLKSLVASQTSEPTVEVKPTSEEVIPSSIVKQMFLMSLIEQLPGTSSEDKSIPFNVLGQTFIKSLIEGSAASKSSNDASPGTSKLFTGSPVTGFQTHEKSEETKKDISKNAEIIKAESTDKGDERAIVGKEAMNKDSPTSGNVSLEESSFMQKFNSIHQNEISPDLKNELCLLKNIWREMFLMFYNLQSNSYHFNPFMNQIVAQHQLMLQKLQNAFDNNFSEILNFSKNEFPNYLASQNSVNKIQNISPFGICSSQSIVSTEGIQVNNNVNSVEKKGANEFFPFINNNSNSKTNIDAASSSDVVTNKLSEVWQITKEMQQSILSMYNLFSCPLPSNQQYFNPFANIMQNNMGMNIVHTNREVAVSQSVSAFHPSVTNVTRAASFECLNSSEHYGLKNNEKLKPNDLASVAVQTNGCHVTNSLDLCSHEKKLPSVNIYHAVPTTVIATDPKQYLPNDNEGKSMHNFDEIAKSKSNQNVLENRSEFPLNTAYYSNDNQVNPSYYKNEQTEVSDVLSNDCVSKLDVLCQDVQMVLKDLSTSLINNKCHQQEETKISNNDYMDEFHKNELTENLEKPLKYIEEIINDFTDLTEMNNSVKPHSYVIGDSLQNGFSDSSKIANENSKFETLNENEQKLLNCQCHQNVSSSQYVKPIVGGFEKGYTCRNVSTVTRNEIAPCCGAARETVVKESIEVMDIIYPPPLQFCSSRSFGSNDVISDTKDYRDVSKASHMEYNSTLNVINELLMFTDVMRNLIDTIAPDSQTEF